MPYKKPNSSKLNLILGLMGLVLCLIGALMIYVAMNRNHAARPKPAHSTKKVASADTNAAQALDDMQSLGKAAIALPTAQQPSPNTNEGMMPVSTQLNTNNPDDAQALPPSNGKLGFVHGKGTDYLVAIPKQYTAKNELIHRKVLDPLLSMINDAKRDGIHLSVVSAYRSYDHQQRIWERKWGNSPNNDIAKAKAILTLSSFPGTSRHHWGTDVDFNSVNFDYWQTPKGRKTHQWLTQHAPRYGFCQTYNVGRHAGYDDEPWHWSHMATAYPYFAQISQPPILNIALTQNIKGAPAALQLADTIMTHVTAISTCPAAQTAHSLALNQPTATVPALAEKSAAPKALAPATVTTPIFVEKPTTANQDPHAPAPMTSSKNPPPNELVNTDQIDLAGIKIRKGDSLD